jgi:hypothetical protein
LTGTVDPPAPLATDQRPDRRGPLRALAVAVGLLVLGAGLVVLALAGRPSAPAQTPAPVPAIPAGSTTVPAPVGPTVTPTAGQAAPSQTVMIVDTRPRAAQRRDLAHFRRRSPTHVPARWVAGFYRLYDVAGRTYGVNWLLIASIHRQETSFSTERDTYHGLNFAGCCGGPMQFNVTNGPVTTWARVSDAYRAAGRPGGYPHPTAAHPSIYDDFDAIMAATQLLSTDGATLALDGGAWQAAYAYYGHDATGVTYADQVIARAISWSQRGFCINCALDPGMVAAVHAAYGAPVLAALEAEAAAKRAAAAARRAAARARRRP